MEIIRVDILGSFLTMEALGLYSNWHTSRGLYIFNIGSTFWNYIFNCTFSEIICNDFLPTVYNLIPCVLPPCTYTQETVWPYKQLHHHTIWAIWACTCTLT